MSEAEERIAREVYNYLNSCSFTELMKVYFFVFGRTEVYVKASDALQLEEKHE